MGLNESDISKQEEMGILLARSLPPVSVVLGIGGLGHRWSRAWGVSGISGLRHRWSQASGVSGIVGFRRRWSRALVLSGIGVVNF